MSTTTLDSMESVRAFAMISSVAGIVMTIVAVFGGAIVMGIMAHKLAGKKGYTGYFWTGFFLNIAGLVYVAGLPDIARRDG